MEENMLGLSGEESGLFHIHNKDERTVNMTEISMEDLFNLPKPSAEEMKWNPKSNPCIAVLCKDEADANRMCELYNDEGFFNPCQICKHRDIIGMTACYCTKNFLQVVVENIKNKFKKKNIMVY
jgi:hypothetical protein